MENTTQDEAKKIKQIGVIVCGCGINEKTYADEEIKKGNVVVYNPGHVAIYDPKQLVEEKGNADKKGK